MGGFYPTVVRGNGVGYATGMGRFGAILGPIVAGYLLSKFPLHYALFFIAAPDLVVDATIGHAVDSSATMMTPG